VHSESVADGYSDFKKGKITLLHSASIIASCVNTPILWALKGIKNKSRSGSFKQSCSNGGLRNINANCKAYFLISEQLMPVNLIELL